MFFVCGDSQRCSISCPFSPSEYLDPSAHLNQVEINKHIMAAVMYFFFPSKEAQIVQQDKSSSRCRRKAAVWLEDLCTGRGHNAQTK